MPPCLLNIWNPLETHNSSTDLTLADALTIPERSYFFSNGISFECQKCGRCCTGEPGTVYVNALDIDNIANYLGITKSETIKRYMYPYKDSYSIREDESGACSFYENGCAVYTVRPLQCRTYPFWFKYLRSEEAWCRVSSDCPGIGQGRVYSKKNILHIVRSTF